MGFDPPAGIIIRPASDADMPAVHALLSARELGANGVGKRSPRYLVAEAPDGIAGAVVLEVFGGDGYLRSLCVDQRFEGNGLGRALVERSLTDAALEALDAVYLVSDSATHLFAQFGFVPIDRSDLPSPVRRAVELGNGYGPTATPMKLLLADR